jgi:uncharacterized protein
MSLIASRREWLWLCMMFVAGIGLASAALWSNGAITALALLFAQPCFALGMAVLRHSRTMQTTGPREVFSLTLLWLIAGLIFLLVMIWPARALQQSGSLQSALGVSVMLGVFACSAWRFSSFVHNVERQRAHWASHMQNANQTEPLAWNGLPTALAITFLLCIAGLLLMPQLLNGMTRTVWAIAFPLASIAAHWTILRSTPAARAQREVPIPAPLPIVEEIETDYLPVRNEPDAASLNDQLFDSLQRGQIHQALAALDAGADPHTLPAADQKDQRSPVMLACLLGDMRVLRRLIESGVDVNTSHAGLTPLLVSTRDSWHGRPDAVMTLLANGADPRAMDNDGNTALHHAARSTDPGVAALLLDAGADINVINHHGWNPLGVACEAGNWRLAKFLLDRRADIEPKEGQSALLACAQASDDDPAGVQLLLRHKAKVDARGEHQFTALLHACANGHTGMAACLLEAHADVNAQDEYGMRAIHYAAQQGYTDVLQTLLRFKADAHAVDEQQRSALIHLCAGQANLDALRVLLAAGIDTQLRDSEGKRALEHALGRGLWPMVAILDPEYPLPSTVSSDSEDLLSNDLFSAESTIKPKTTEMILIEMLGERQFESADALLRMDATWNRRSVLEVAQTAIESHDEDLLRWLMSHGLELHLRAGNGRTALESVLDHLDTATLHLPILWEGGQQFTGAGLLTRWLSTCHALRAPPIGEYLANNLIERGADIFARDANGETALCLAINNQYTHCVRLLLEKGADPNQRDAHGLSPLHRAAHGHSDEIVKQLIRYGANPNARTPDGSTPLGIALLQGKRELARWLDWSEWAPPARALREADLPAAAMTGDSNAVERLLQLGLPVDSVDTQGCTALLRASGGGREPVVRLLLEMGASTHIAARTGATPLSAAISMRQTPIVRHLLNAGADTEQLLPGGVSPLMLAAALGLPDILQLLLSKNADVNRQDDQGLSALHCAALFAFSSRDRARAQAAFDVLLLSNADIEALTHHHQNVLLLLLGSRAEAGATCDEELLLAALEQLLQESIELNAQDGRGFSALHLAAQHGLGRIVKRLLREGADRNKRDTLGRTPYDIALMRGFVDIASEFEPPRGPMNSPSMARFLKDRP